jgi:transposase-like protein
MRLGGLHWRMCRERDFVLDNTGQHVQYTMRRYSISEVAREVHVRRTTLYAWIRRKKIPAPQRKTLGGVRVSLWTAKDLIKIKQYKEEHYREKPTLRKNYQQPPT